MDAPKTPPLEVATTNKNVQDTTTPDAKPDAKPIEGEAKKSIRAKKSVSHKKKRTKDPKKPKRAKSGL